MHRFVGIGVLVVGLTSSTVLSEVRDKEKFKKPVIDLSCPKYMVHTDPQTQRGVVSIRVRIRNINERLWCPEIQWCTGIGAGQYCPSAHESDCPPFDEASESDLISWSSDSQWFSLEPGEIILMAKIKKSGKVVASKTCTITVR